MNAETCRLLGSLFPWACILGTLAFAGCVLAVRMIRTSRLGRELLEAVDGDYQTARIEIRNITRLQRMLINKTTRALRKTFNEPRHRDYRKAVDGFDDGSRP